MDNRVTYRRRLSYNTKSNSVRKVRTPGGRLVVQYREKLASGPKCGFTGKNLQGITKLRPKKYAHLARKDKTVSRAYGGTYSAQVVRDRIVRAFLIEEQKIVKRVLKAQKAKKKAKKGTKTA